MADPLEHNMGTDSVERSIGVLIGRIDGLTLIVNNVQTEVKSLRDDFSKMEVNRLSKLEVAFATVKTEIETRAKVMAMWWGIGASVVATLMASAITYIVIHIVSSTAGK